MLASLGCVDDLVLSLTALIVNRSDSDLDVWQSDRSLYLELAANFTHTIADFVVQKLIDAVVHLLCIVSVPEHVWGRQLCSKGVTLGFSSLQLLCGKGSGLRIPI